MSTESLKFLPVVCFYHCRGFLFDIFQTCFVKKYYYIVMSRLSNFACIEVVMSYNLRKI